MSPKKIEFNNGETVVYPKHGVGEIIKIELMEIASIKTMFYVVKMEQSKLTIRVPIDKQEDVGLNETSTEGYEMLDLKLSKEFSLSAGTKLDLIIFGNNLLDEVARNHTSFVKNEVPLAGRNYGVRFNLNF